MFISLSRSAVMHFHQGVDCPRSQPDSRKGWSLSQLTVVERNPWSHAESMLSIDRGPVMRSPCCHGNCLQWSSLPIQVTYELLDVITSLSIGDTVSYRTKEPWTRRAFGRQCIICCFKIEVWETMAPSSQVLGSWVGNILSPHVLDFPRETDEPCRYEVREPRQKKTPWVIKNGSCLIYFLSLHQIHAICFSRSIQLFFGFGISLIFYWDSHWLAVNSCDHDSNSHGLRALISIFWYPQGR